MLYTLSIVALSWIMQAYEENTHETSRAILLDLVRTNI